MVSTGFYVCTYVCGVISIWCTDVGAARLTRSAQEKKNGEYRLLCMYVDIHNTDARD